MGLDVIGYLVISAVLVSAAAAVYMSSVAKRLCPNCRTMMSKMKTECPKCGKQIPLNY